MQARLAAEESEHDYAAWKRARTDLLMRASQPSISVLTVTAEIVLLRPLAETI